jgi:hypothetical protein
MHGIPQFIFVQQHYFHTNDMAPYLHHNEANVWVVLP